MAEIVDDSISINMGSPKYINDVIEINETVIFSPGMVS